MKTASILAALTVPVAGIAAGMLAAPGAAQERPAWSWPETLENAQLLPADIGPERLRGVMLGFVNALGVRCSYCHVGSGPDLGTYDFASDANEHKGVSRRMMRMTAAINAEHLAGLEGHGEARVTCYTCHRGSTLPLTSPPPEAE